MLNIGIIGCGKIAQRFMKGALELDDVTVIACAAREVDRAEQFAHKFGIEHAYGSYDSMLELKDLHAVYIATPPFMHEEQIRLCLSHNKHVICEKPFVQNEDTVHALFKIAKDKGLILMEANKTIFTPTWNSIRKSIQENTIGNVRYLEGSYTYRFPTADHWVFDPKRMGGGMMDVGVYPLTVALSLMGLNVKEMKKMVMINEKSSDDLTHMLLRFENGVMASVKGGIGVETDNHFTIYGDLGRIRVPRFSKNPYYFLEVYGREEETIKLVFESEFRFEIEHFAQCIKDGLTESPWMSEAMSAKIIQLITTEMIT
jgi:predicted dehydrogenase